MHPHNPEPPDQPSVRWSKDSLPPTPWADGGKEDDATAADPVANRRAFFLMLFWDVVQKLTPQQQEILDLVVFGKLTMTEAARKLGVPRTTAHDQYKKALLDLRRLAKIDPTVKLVFEVLHDLY